MFGILIAGGDATEVAMAYVVLRMAYLVFLCLFLTRRSSIFRLWPFEVDRQLLRQVLRPGFSSLSLYLGGTILTQGMSTAVGVVLGPVQLVVFSTVRTLVNILKQLVNMLNHSVHAEYTYAYSKADGQQMRRLYRVNLTIILAIGVASGIGLLVFGEALLGWWTKGVLQVEKSFFIMMVISAMVGIVTAFYMTIIMATNHYRLFGLLYLALTALCVAASPVLLRWGGMVMTGASLVVLEVILLFAAFSVVRPMLRSMRGFNRFDNPLSG